MARRLKQNILVGDGTTYTLGVAIVRTKTEKGTPRHIELVAMDEQVDLTDPNNREFITCYIPKICLRPGDTLEIPSTTPRVE